MAQSAFARQPSSPLVMEPIAFATTPATGSAFDASEAATPGGDASPRGENRSASTSPIIGRSRWGINSSTGGSITTPARSDFGSSDVAQSAPAARRPHHRRSQSMSCEVTSLWSSSGPWSAKAGGIRGSELTISITESDASHGITASRSLEYLQSPSPRGSYSVSQTAAIAGHHSKYWSSPAKSPVAQLTPVKGHRRYHSISEIDGSLFEDFAANDWEELGAHAELKP
ncbi:hypothetical protein CLOM_g18106 [Closterium sp. NIES-68]|nr:hypothetical protein CLOM_g18106 [Closterium sp. NIES-68]GJP72467.1 hypothetical protein CLOP_g3199 [Closterium sp. NIES-67]